LRLVADDADVQVIDLAHRAEPTLDWEVTMVFVQRQGTGVPSPRRDLTVDWDALTGFAARAGRPAATLIAAFDKMRPAYLPARSTELEPRMRAPRCRRPRRRAAAEVLEELP